MSLLGINLIKTFLPEKSGSKKYNDIYFTKNNYELPALVISKQKGMKAPWIIATSRHDLKTREILHLYSKRWGIETLFRDIKDYQFGMGLSNTHSKNTARRDRVLFISALAIALLTLLGKAGEDAGLERTLKANTVKTRSYSLWRQGCEYYSLIPNMKEHRLVPLLDKFNEYLEGFFAFKYVLSKLDK